jgi:hypothetical protein
MASAAASDTSIRPSRAACRSGIMISADGVGPTPSERISFDHGGELPGGHVAPPALTAYQARRGTGQAWQAERSPREKVSEAGKLFYANAYCGAAWHCPQAAAVAVGRARKRVQFDDETWRALDLLARDNMKTFQELHRRHAHRSGDQSFGVPGTALTHPASCGTGEALVAPRPEGSLLDD